MKQLWKEPLSTTDCKIVCLLLYFPSCIRVKKTLLKVAQTNDISRSNDSISKKIQAFIGNLFTSKFQEIHLVKMRMNYVCWDFRLDHNEAIIPKKHSYTEIDSKWIHPLFGGQTLSDQIVHPKASASYMGYRSAPVPITSLESSTYFAIVLA